MRLLDKQGLGSYVEDAVAIPMMAGAGDQVLWVEVRGDALTGGVRVVAET
jgi:hypothetical protein